MLNADFVVKMNNQALPHFNPHLPWLTFTQNSTLTII